MAVGRTNAAGGMSLNFDVKAYATEALLLAATPKENTVGIITTVGITAWIFSATEPETPEKGMVWITVGTESAFEFNALKKNALHVYPLRASQYVDGAWVDVTAMSYQGGEWISWWSGELYQNGNEFEVFTGGWQARGWKYNDGCTAVAPQITKESDSVTVTCATGSYVSGIYEIAKDLDVTEYTTLKINVTSKAVNLPTEWGDHECFALCVIEDRNDTYPNIRASLPIYNCNIGENHLDISTVYGPVCIGIVTYCANSETNYVSYDEIKMEA